MASNFNEQFEAWKKNGNFDQAPVDIPDADETAEEPDDQAEINGNGESGMKKTSFAELRDKRKVPRLKKSMVLTIITGGIFVFLILVNLLIQKKEEQKKYFDEQKNNVATGSDFSLGDLEKRWRQSNNGKNEMTESDEFYFQSPPAYTSIPAHRVASVSTGSGTPAQSGPRSSPTPHYSDSDLLAIRAQIGKEGGYGLGARNVGYNSTNSLTQETGRQTLSREEYTRQSIEDITRLSQAISGDNNAQQNSTRYTDAGRYNPDNPPQGGDVFYLNDTCLFPGTIIHAILVSRIDTDYPGPIHARVTENVYDSMTGTNLLIPQGSILQGNYSSSSIGVAKVQIAWELMVVNYGGVAYQVSLGGMAGVDKRGRAGIAGTLDDHYFEWLKAAGMISLFSMLNSEVLYLTNSQTSAQVRDLLDINQGIVNRVGDKLIERALDIQPTVRVANGTAVSVSVNTIVNLRPFPAIKAEEKWIRK